MSALRPYWQRHPIQLRMSAVVALVFLPLILAVIAAWCQHDEIARTLRRGYSEVWSIIRRGCSG
ncbi:hypothetical protein KTE60_22445 [Burkholderia multivorans]|uniref:hypothetical protein n=1 Tax=Burkholderia multivorans TaxID=87883 RepID=UPI001C2240CF|nr:hypothetical protein [Burkholderia multivorans]MBU9632048.1 hypothetical protein [Burkholderia multivorans]